MGPYWTPILGPYWMPIDTLNELSRNTFVESLDRRLSYLSARLQSVDESGGNRYELYERQGWGERLSQQRTRWIATLGRAADAPSTVAYAATL